MVPKRYLLIIVGIGCLFMSYGAFAGGVKIGFIDTARVLDESPQAEAARKRIEKEFAPRDKEIVKAQKEVVKMEEKMSRDGPIMSDTERQKMERDVLNRKRDLKRSSEEAREDFNIRRNEEFGKIRRLVRKVIVDIAQKQKFDLILESGVVYASDQINITNQVVDQLKREAQHTKKK